VRSVPVHAFGIAATLRPRDVCNLFGWATDPGDARYRLTKTFAMSRHDEGHFIVVYDFGAVVFFDCSKDERDAFMTKLLASLPPEPHPPLVDDYLVEIREGAEPAVTFDRAVLPTLDAHVVELLSLILAQSVAMDYYEEDVAAAYKRVEEFANVLAARGKIPRSEREVHRFVGSILVVRNQIAMTLSLLDAPSATWEREVYDKLYRNLRVAFEIGDRYQTIEHKIQLIQQNLDIIVDLVQYKRAKVLELIVIGLIAFEVVLAIGEKFVFRH
jgi:uncharacterized Rmd1/YagE family protein